MPRLLAVLGILASSICAVTFGQEPAGPVRLKITIRLKNVLVVDFVNALEDFVRKLDCNLGSFPTHAEDDYRRNVTLTPDHKANSLTISATPLYFADLVKMIDQFDQLPPQIMIQVLVARRELKSGRIEILSRPQVRVLEAQTALLNIGTPTFLRTNPSAIQVQITPKILPDAKVLMRVIPEVASPKSKPVPLGNGQTGPVVHVQHFERTLTAEDGETVVMNGMKILEESFIEQECPWLGDLPYVGSMLRKLSHDVSRSELFIVMTPRIIRTPLHNE